MKDRGIDALVNDSLVGTGTLYPLFTDQTLGSILVSYTLLRDRIELTISNHVGRLVHFPSFSPFIKFSNFTLFPTPPPSSPPSTLSSVPY
jgi:hypothetical protein